MDELLSLAKGAQDALVETLMSKLASANISCRWKVHSDNEIYHGEYTASDNVFSRTSTLEMYAVKHLI